MLSQQAVLTSLIPLADQGFLAPAQGDEIKEVEVGIAIGAGLILKDFIPCPSPLHSVHVMATLLEWVRCSAESTKAAYGQV